MVQKEGGRGGVKSMQGYDSPQSIFKQNALYKLAYSYEVTSLVMYLL
jgi:hypothetical protein